jgi:hypothetical protein
MSQSLRKKAIFLSEESERWIVVTTKPLGVVDDKADKSVKWTESVNASIQTLKHILASSLPELTTTEWAIIFNIIKIKTEAKGIVENHTQFLAFEKYDISEDILAFNYLLDSKQQCDDAKLLALKMHNINKVEQLAILYFVQVFLLNDWTGCEVAEIVEQIKKELYS